MLCHIIHVAMEPRVQPFEQTRFGVTQVGVRDADVLKAEFAAPRANLPHELGGVDRNRRWLFGLHDFA